MAWLHLLAHGLLWVGGLNWGLVGLFDFNLVESLGLPSGLVKLIYGLVGVSTVYIILNHQKDCKVCEQMAKK